MKKWLVVFLLAQISCVNRSTQEGFQLQKGDFLFQDLDSSPLCDAIEEISNESTKVIYMAPDGENLNTQIAKELAQETHLLLVSGHYEGIDQRVRDQLVDREVSIGDYVLTNGSLAASVLVLSAS